MKAVMMSIKPKWVEKIINGEKTVEVRKTRPRIDTPFKVYIYCTKGKDLFNNSGIATTNSIYIACKETPYMYKMNGKVVAEFTCNKIEFVPNDYYRYSELNTVVKGTCLYEGELLDYMADRIGCYKWYISDLKVYDKPKRLQDFINYNHWRNNLKLGCYPDNCRLPILTRPPQSWCYVKER